MTERAANVNVACIRPAPSTRLRAPAMNLPREGCFSKHIWTPYIRDGVQTGDLTPIKSIVDDTCSHQHLFCEMTRAGACVAARLRGGTASDLLPARTWANALDVALQATALCGIAYSHVILSL